MLRLLQQFLNRLSALLKNGDKQHKLDLEIQSHLELMTEENIESGMSPEQAKKAALKRFGATEKLKDECREAWGTRIISDMVRDLRLGLRHMPRNPWFSIAIIVTLALGIGINTTVFTTVNSVLFKPFPIPNGDRLVAIRSHHIARPAYPYGVSYPDFKEFRGLNRSFEGMGALQGGSFTLGEDTDSPAQYFGGYITMGLFEVLSATPIMGRGFQEEDYTSQSSRAVLISYDVWQNRYGGSNEVIGKNVRLNRAQATIVGVMPEGFHFSTNEQVWVPLTPPAGAEDRSLRTLSVFGMLKVDYTIKSARADLTTIAHRIATDHSDVNKDIGVTILTTQEYFNNDRARNGFTVLLGAVNLVLLIVCANVANMMLSRNIKRRHEFSVRSSLGAARWRLIRQLLIESILLSSLGGLLGLVIALFGVKVFDQTVQNNGVPYWMSFDMDFRVFLYFAGMCVLSGIVFGLIPALRTTRINLSNTLKDTGRGTSGYRAGKLTAVLVVLQFTLTTVLLSGAALMVRSYFVLQNSNEFIPRENIMMGHHRLPSGDGSQYEADSAELQFYDTLFERAKAIPEVEAIAAATNPPGGGAQHVRYEVDGKPAMSNRGPLELSYIVATNDYLSVIGLPILQGSGFDEFIHEKGERVAIVTKEFAHYNWPGESSIGKRFRFIGTGKEEPWTTIIGVSADIRQYPMSSSPTPLVFFPHIQHLQRPLHLLLLRSSGNASSLNIPVSRLIQELDDDIMFRNARTLQEHMDDRLKGIKVFGTLFLCFAVIALVVACIGIYGVIAQSTSLRNQEIGIRIALGASTSKVLKLVMARGFFQISIGLLLGLLGTFATNKLMSSFSAAQTSSQDLIVNFGIISILFLVGILACWIPARHAASLQPSNTLRHD